MWKVRKVEVHLHHVELLLRLESTCQNSTLQAQRSNAAAITAAVLSQLAWTGRILTHNAVGSAQEKWCGSSKVYKSKQSSNVAKGSLKWLTCMFSGRLWCLRSLVVHSTVMHLHSHKHLADKIMGSWCIALLYTVLTIKPSFKICNNKKVFIKHDKF